MSLLSIKSIAPDAELSVAIALHFAKLSLPIWSEAYPNDSRPEDAIKAVEHYSAAYAANAAHAAYADSANAAYAAYAATYAAKAAYAYAAANAANAAFYANAAAKAAANAAHAVGATNPSAYKSFIHLELRKQLSGILSYKVENGQSFGEPDAVFENLAESDAKLFLFNLDSLR